MDVLCVVYVGLQYLFTFNTLVEQACVSAY